jgi:hypothetical protein
MAIPSTINIKRTTLATETQYHTYEQNIANHQTEIDHYGRSVLIMLCATVLYTQPAQEEERKEKKRKEKKRKRTRAQDSSSLSGQSSSTCFASAYASPIGPARLSAKKIHA